MEDDAADELAEDVAYENALDLLPGMTGMDSSILAHLLSVQEDEPESGPMPEQNETLDRERALAVQKSQNSSRPKPSSPMS